MGNGESSGYILLNSNFMTYDLLLINAVCNFKQNYVVSESKNPPFPLPPSPFTPSERILDNFVAHGVMTY